MTTYTKYKIIAHAVSFIIGALITLALTSCSRETSFECRACETEVTVIRDGRQVGVARYEVACDTAKVGEQIIHGPTVTWVYKTECR